MDLQSQLYTWFSEVDRMFQKLILYLFGVPIPVGLGWLLPVLLILIIFFIVFWIRRRVHYTHPQEGNSSSVSVPAGEEIHRWWTEGETRAEQGDYREGIRCLFRSVLAALEERKVLIRGDHKTNREYRKEVEQNGSELLPLFSALVLRFDLIWYGRIQADEGDYRDFRQLSTPLVKGDDGG